MPQNYVPIFIFLAVVGILIPVTLLVARIIRTQSPNRVKLMPYECGIDPYDSARGRYTVRFYIIAIMFVAVSYTHLDVYKRQSLYLESFCCSLCP